MKLSKIAILAVKGSQPGIVLDLAIALDVSDLTVRRYINGNDDNLTKAAALKVIREHTGLTDEQILEDDTVEETIKEEAQK